MNHWYVVETHSMAEERAAKNLTAQGYKAYLPRYLKKRTHARRVDWVSRPLFPRYLFAHIDIDAMQWRAIRSTIGVKSFLCQGENPCRVPEGIVEGILIRENEKGYIDLSREAQFEKHQVVEIANGPMAELRAIFECVDDKYRAIVLINLLGRQVRMRVPMELIRASA